MSEDRAYCTVVELQHVRDDATYDRFLSSHCLGLVEQITSSERYVFAREVYTLMVLTRWPREERLRFGRAVCDLDPVTEEGSKLGVYWHRPVFVNVQAPEERVPAELRALVGLIKDTLDGQVEEGEYPDEISRRILGQIARTKLSPEENAQLKDEATWEAAKQEARQEGEAKGRAEGRAQGLREGLLDLAELLGLALTGAQRTHRAAMGPEPLPALRQQLKQSRRWPT